MTLSFPRDLPAGVRFVPPTRFEPQYRMVESTTRGGSPQVVGIAPDLWTMRYTTEPLSETMAEQVRAWLATLRGGQRFFKAYDPLREYPQGYAAGFTGLTRAVGGGLFDGTATISAVAATLDSLTLSTLPAGFALSPGDMISVAYSDVSELITNRSTGRYFVMPGWLGGYRRVISNGRRTLHRIVEGAVANGSGAATVSIEPVLFPGAPIGTAGAVTLAKPWCQARIDAASIDVKWNLGRWATVSFSASQVY